MKRLLFLLCFLFAFISIPIAKAIPKQNLAKEKQKCKSENAKSVSQVAKFTQNQMLFRAFEPFEFESPTDYFYGYIVKEKKQKHFIPKAPKPCKIPIRQKVRNKDNI